MKNKKPFGADTEGLFVLNCWEKRRYESIVSRPNAAATATSAGRVVQQQQQIAKCAENEKFMPQR
jgi:hypothetical protein